MPTISNAPPYFIWVSLRYVLGLMLLANASAILANYDTSLLAYPAFVSPPDSDLRLDIDSPNQSWSIQLQDKSLLGSVSIAQNALYEVPEFYNGVVIGEPDSWVRLARDSASSPFTGHVFSKGDLFALQLRDDMGGHAIARLTHSDSVLPDVPVTDSITSRALPDRTGSNNKAIRVGIVIDSLYNEQHNGRGLAHALGVINGVDGLYQDQLGLAVIVESFRVYDRADTDPLRELTGTTDGLLEQYRDIRIQDSELGSDLALVHLFSGHNGAEEVIGLGWIGTVCSTNGYDLSLSTPFPFDMLLAAHEIAHNLGAIHDDDAQCSIDDSISGDEVMWSELSGSTRPTFSSCSLTNLNKTINSAECVADNIDVNVSLAPIPTFNPDQVVVEVAVFNQDESRRANRVASLTTFPLGTVLSDSSAGCLIQGSTLNCQHEPVNAQEESRLSVNANFTGIENPIITTELNLERFSDTRHQDNRATIQIDSNGLPVAGVAPTNLSTSQASDGYAPVTDAAPANDEAQTTTDSGGSAGVGAGSTGTLMLLMLGLFLLPGLRSLRSTLKPRLSSV